MREFTLELDSTIDVVDGVNALAVDMFFLKCGSHDNVPRLMDVFLDDSSREGKLTLIYGKTDCHLSTIIQSKQLLTDDHVQYFAYQLLRALKFAHSAGVCHGAVSPMNIHVCVNCDLQLRQFHCPGVPWPKDHDSSSSSYETNTNNSPPEVILGVGPQFASDIWGVGLVVAQLLLRRPLFTARDVFERVRQIVHLLGSPDDEDLEWITSVKAREFVRRVPVAPRVRPLPLPESSPLALDFLDSLLKFNPAKRPTAEEALQHPFLAELHDVDDEPVCPDLCPPLELLEISTDSAMALLREQVHQWGQVNVPLVKAAGIIVQPLEPDASHSTNLAPQTES